MIFRDLHGIQRIPDLLPPRATQTLIEKELAELIVGALNLDADPQTIEPDAPLYLEGLGLDSIDLLELSVVISKKYGFQIKSDDPDIETIFSSLKDLGTTVTNRKTTG